MAQDGRSGSEISHSVGTSKPFAEEAPVASSDRNRGDRVYIGRTPPSLKTLRRNRARPSSANIAAGVLSGNKLLSRLAADDGSPLGNPATPSRQSIATDEPSTRYRATPHPGPQSSWSSPRQSPAATQSADYAGVLMAQDVPISSLGLRPHLPPARIRPRVSKGWRRCLADFVEHILLGFAIAYVFVVCSFFGRMYGIW